MSKHEVIIGGVDPGGTSGWGIVWVPFDVLLDSRVNLPEHIDWDCGEFTGSEDRQARDILALMDEFPEAAWVFESFNVRKMGVDLSPCRITAKVNFGRYVMRKKRVAFFQPPETAMTTVTDLRQKKWGLWEKGKPHARDGIKHAVTFARRCQMDPSIRLKAFGPNPRRRSEPDQP